MQRAMVIRAYGDLGMSGAMLAPIESAEVQRLRDEIAAKDKEIKALRSQVEFNNYVQDKYYRKKIQEIQKNYPIRKAGFFERKFDAIRCILVVLLNQL